MGPAFPIGGCLAKRRDGFEQAVGGKSAKRAGNIDHRQSRQIGMDKGGCHGCGKFRIAAADQPVDDLVLCVRVAESLEDVGEAFEMDLLFVPELKAFRQHPDFMPLLDRLGVTRYWKRKNCVWSGDRVICPQS